MNYERHPPLKRTAMPKVKRVNGKAICLNCGKILKRQDGGALYCIWDEGCAPIRLKETKQREPIVALFVNDILSKATL